MTSAEELSCTKKMGLPVKSPISCNIDEMESGRVPRLVQALERGEDVGDSAAREFAELVETARGAWPSIDVDLEDFVRYVGERVDRALTLEATMTAIEGLCLRDLYLACACARGDSRALAAFDEHMLAPIAKHVRRLCDADDDVEEVMQILRTRMLVHRGDEKARILSYTGRGPLAGWLRVAGVRIAHDLRRARGATVESSDPNEPGPEEMTPVDPELAVIKARFGEPFRNALNDVLAELPDRERNILAMSIIDGLSTDAIGALYRVNGSTVRRWIAQARDRVLEGVRTRLKAELDLRSAEFDSLMGLVRSQLDLNLSQLLGRPVFPGG